MFKLKILKSNDLKFDELIVGPTCLNSYKHEILNSKVN